ncbi:MAG: hypothetical protein AAGK21_11130 [Bacteroidota bacterium]
MNLSIPIATAALLLGGLSFTPETPDTPDVHVIESTAYTVTITKTRRGATVRLEPNRDARPAWRTPLVAGALMTADGNVCSSRGPAPDGYTKVEWTEFRLSPMDGRGDFPTYEADIRRVDFETIAGLALRAEDGQSWITVCENFPAQSQGGGDPPAEDPPKEDPPADDGDSGSDNGSGGDSGNDGDDKDDEPCNGIVDPWTGECTPDVRNPWPEEEGEQIMLSI